jgi:NAD+ synthase
MKKTYQDLIKALKKEVKNTGLEKVVIGLSGGLDSAVTLKLAVDALGADNVTALIMPEIGLSSQENIDHAKILAEHLEVKSFYQPINSFLVSFNFIPWGQNHTSQLNLRSRIRMILLYHFANKNSALVLGTSNKSELMLGYGTKYGDLAADIEVIGNLYKTDVFELARYMGMPDELINKTPTAELAPGQTDEDELGATYDKLDIILKLYEEGRDEEDMISRGLDPTLTRKTVRRIKNNEHKLKIPPVLTAEIKKANEINPPEIATEAPNVLEGQQQLFG